MCMICTWVKALVSSCQYAPSLTPGSHAPFGAAAQAASLVEKPCRPTAHSPLGRSASRSTRRLPAPPVAMIVSHTTALIAIRTDVVRPGLPGRSPPYAVRPLRVAFAPSATHVGHWKPTAASRMQSGQIVRSQRWHRMYDSRPGCR